ncbi:MAG TPA: saccharopine dehydrogenase NADP-binding domain-containing protein [Kineosporiaceae bacterium]|nr:saccharopine dehydrogenase NADP-binding domain-containing protein [Kineosporiaceae bacterium]
MPTTPSTPSGRVVLFGATGYTGDLTARALVAAGVRPVLAGRDATRLDRLAADLGGLETAVADVTRPQSVRALVERGDVLVTTVGPFARWGAAALEAAVAAGAHYVDSTGEGSFIRAVVEQGGLRAADAGSVLLTAFGYDYVPGNLAAALALQRASGTATSVDVAYFMTGASGAGGASGGTRASAVGMIAEPGYALRSGRIVPERPGFELWHAEARGRVRPLVTVPASEQFFVPRLAPGLDEVRVGLGWFGPLTQPLALASRVAGAVDRVPPLRSGLGRVLSPLVRRVARGSSGGPDAAARARTGSLVVADVRDAARERLAHVELTGPNGYTLTADLLGWAARALAGLVPGVALPAAAGALGPVEAFGLDTLQAACAEAGLVEATAGAGEAVP